MTASIASAYLERGAWLSLGIVAAEIGLRVGLGVSLIDSYLGLTLDPLLRIFLGW